MRRRWHPQEGVLTVILNLLKQIKLNGQLRQGVKGNENPKFSPDVARNIPLLI
jgi:hypothetical protein